MADTNTVDWQNFNAVADIIEDFADKSKDGKKLKDANEALGQLLGVSEKAVFQKMNAEQQNAFLNGVMDQYQKSGSNPADMAQKLLEGLRLKTPQLAPGTPAPVYGLAPPVPGGMGGGGRPQQQQQNWQPPAQQQQQEGEQWPPPYVPPADDNK